MTSNDRQRQTLTKQNSDQLSPVPYMASAGWYRGYLQGRLAGADEAESRCLADAAAAMKRRDLARTVVAGAHGQPPLQLSVPVEGGASSVKRIPPQQWRISDHGRWRETHLGALNAAYGQTPFYLHLEPSLTDAIKGAYAGTPLADLSEKLHRIVLGILGDDAAIDALRRLRDTRREFAESLHTEFSAGLTYDLSVFDVIFRKGPSAIFGLV